MVHLMILLMELLVLPLYCQLSQSKWQSGYIFSQLDYQQVISILGRFNDQDSVVLQFPLRVKQVTIQKLRQTIKQSIILNACSTAEASGQGAITSLNINFPITILTYKVYNKQSVVITSEKQLFTYMSNVSSTELFSVNYRLPLH
jgi:hypothetical protein